MCLEHLMFTQPDLTLNCSLVSTTTKVICVIWKGSCAAGKGRSIDRVTDEELEDVENGQEEGGQESTESSSSSTTLDSERRRRG